MSPVVLVVRRDEGSPGTDTPNTLFQYALPSDDCTTLTTWHSDDMASDVSRDIYAAAKRIQETAAKISLAIERAREASDGPDLHQLLEQLVEDADFLVHAFAPSDDVSEPQPVSFQEPATGWDFDPWMNEKTKVIQRSSHNAQETWKHMTQAMEDGEYTWADAAGDFVQGDLGDTPVNRREYLEFSVGEVEAKAAVICELISTRLSAHAPGKPGWQPPPIR